MAKPEEDPAGGEGALQRHDTELTDYQPPMLRHICWNPKFMIAYVFIFLIVTFAVFVTIFHVQVVQILEPFSNIIQNVPVGFLIPGIIIFAVSIPPLCGLEILAVLCGAVYGLYVGFAIIAAGTLLGEVATWLIFKVTYRAKARRHERANVEYEVLARLTREGGFWAVLLARFSLVPAHFTTALFSSWDAKFWHFIVASIVTLPKHLVLVYLGCTPSQTITAASAGVMQKSTTGSATHPSIWSHVELDDSTIVQLAMLGGATLVTAGLVFFVWNKTRKIRAVLLEEQNRRKVLDAVAPGPHPLAAGSGNHSGNSSRSNSNRSASSSHYNDYSGQDAREKPAIDLGFTACDPFDARNDNERLSLVAAADETAAVESGTSVSISGIYTAPERSSSLHHDQFEGQQSRGRQKARRPRGGLGIQTWAKQNHFNAASHSPREINTFNYFKSKSPPPPPPVPYVLSPPPSLPTIRPSSSTLSIASFSRPRPPSRRTPSVSSSVYTCATSAPAAAAGATHGGGAGNSHAGYPNHGRFNSEDFTPMIDGEAGIAVTTATTATPSEQHPFRVF